MREGTGKCGVVGRVMKAISQAESGGMSPSESHTLFPDVVSLKQRVQRISLLSAAFQGVELSPHVSRLIEPPREPAPAGPAVAPAASLAMAV